MGMIPVFPLPLQHPTNPCFALDPVPSLVRKGLAAGHGRDECLHRLGERTFEMPQEMEDDLSGFTKSILPEDC